MNLNKNNQFDSPKYDNLGIHPEFHRLISKGGIVLHFPLENLDFSKEIFRSVYLSNY